MAKTSQPSVEPDPEPVVEPAPLVDPVTQAAAAIITWGDENGHPGGDLAILRNYAPHDLLEAYDEAVAASAPPEAPLATEEAPTGSVEETPAD